LRMSGAHKPRNVWQRVNACVEVVNLAHYSSRQATDESR
jgi:hypothetical protein